MNNTVAADGRCHIKFSAKEEKEKERGGRGGGGGGEGKEEVRFMALVE